MMVQIVSAMPGRQRQADVQVPGQPGLQGETSKKQKKLRDYTGT